MIKDILKTILFFIAAFTIGGLVMVIYACTKICGFLFTPCIPNQMEGSMSILMIKQTLVFIMYTFAGVCLYLLDLHSNTDANIMNSLLIMWTIMIIIEGIIPMIKEYIKR